MSDAHHLRWLVVAGIVLFMLLGLCPFRFDPRGYLQRFSLAIGAFLLNLGIGFPIWWCVLVAFAVQIPGDHWPIRPRAARVKERGPRGS
jgi:hypothetical protein